MNALYPDTPPGIPADLTQPGSSYKTRAWGALAGLLMFVALYFGLIAWFLTAAWRLVMGGMQGGDGSFFGFLLAIPALFLVVFLTKGLFFVRRGELSGLTEVTVEDEPELAAFVHRIADDAGAPRPHRIFLSSRVNAAVFYDLTMWNLLFPSRKNLEIGLGLVNVLSLDEFKAVIAHEFGHFSQKSMRVGTWVYLSRQVIGHLVTRRDALDTFLSGLSRFDLRVAWIGWVMRLVIWSIRAVLDTAFRGVVALERALSREMEFQADLVAVSLTGSDSLLHALHCLSAADDAWDKALHFSAMEASNGSPVQDIFTVQTRILERLRIILDTPDHGCTPHRPEGDTEWRVFRAGIAEAPRMWATHPPNHEREDNARKRYFASTLDERSAWELFADATVTREGASRKLQTAAVGEAIAEAVPMADTLTRIDAQFDRSHLKRRYRGAWLDRSLTRSRREVRELISTDLPSQPDAILAAIDALYPESLPDDLERLGDLSGEKVQLQGLKEGFLKAPGGVLMFRGQQVTRRELPELIERIGQEWAESQKTILAHDRAVRNGHRAAARSLGGGWEDYLTGLLSLIHYAEHLQADIADANAIVSQVFAIVTADNKVTQSELRRLISACEDVQQLLSNTFAQKADVKVGAAVAARLEGQWSNRLPDLQLFPPSAEDLSDNWLPAMESWVSLAVGRLSQLRGRALDVLVETEDHVADSLRRRVDPGNAPSAPSVPKNYARCCLGDERPRQKRLGWWDRFQTADGWMAGSMRTTVAAGVLLPVLALSWSQGNADVTIHNGLSIPVQVQLGSESVMVQPMGSSILAHSPGSVTVTASTLSGEIIETFDAGIDGSFVQPVYNVAHASALVEGVAVYGSRMEQPPRFLGAPRWINSDADHLFEDPPESINTDNEGGTSDVLDAMDGVVVLEQLSVVTADIEREQMALSHVRWDPPGSPDFTMWVFAASEQPELSGVLQARIEQVKGTDLVLTRALMDVLPEEQRAAQCVQLTAAAQAAPDDADAAYLSARCADDDALFITAHQRFPEHTWLAWAAGRNLAEQAEWSRALAAMRVVLTDDAVATQLGFGLWSSVIRLHRMTDGAEPLELPPEVALWMETETALAALPSSDMMPIQHAVHALLHGRITDALSTPGIEDDIGWLRIMAAASVGASEAEVAAGLREPVDTFGEAVLWVAYGLALREGADTTAVQTALLNGQPKTGEVLGAFADLRDDPAALDAVLIGSDPALRGAARAAGVIALGEEAPESWREEARRLLLPFERPHFGE